MSISAQDRIGIITYNKMIAWFFIFLLIPFLIYKLLTLNYDYFKIRNIPYIKPVPIFGNFAKMLLQQETFFHGIQRLYFHFKGKRFFGVFELRNPILVIRDPEIVKKISVKDFDHFVNHRSTIEAEDDVLFGNSLLMLKDQKWKDMRSTLSPAFTGSKMRLMFSLVEEVNQRAEEYLLNEMKENSNSDTIDIDMKDFFTRYTNDIIASASFGLDINSLEDKNNDFHTMGKKISNFNGKTAIKFFLVTNFRKITRFFKMGLFDKKFVNYFSGIVLNTIKYRTENNIIRPDMINLIMEARKGTLRHDDRTRSESIMFMKNHRTDWTNKEVVSQCFIFFIAGFESSSSLMSFCAHELMINPEVQDKLIDEIDTLRNELNGQPLTYEMIQKMKFMDMVLCETLRKWPPFLALDRVCNKQYVVEEDVSTGGDRIIIESGQAILIPMIGFHYDPKYFPEPQKFNPDRFSEENKLNFNANAYMPFGIGPRNCIGFRFAMMEAKAILYHLLSKFRFEYSPKTVHPIELCPAGFQLQSKHGFWMKLKLRKC